MSERKKIKVDPSELQAAVPALEVKGFSWAYGFGGTKVLKDVSFTVPKGSRVLVIGKNGAGKSTLLRCLSGQHLHEENEIRILGTPAYYSKSVTHLGSDWRSNPLVKSDVSTERLLMGVGDDKLLLDRKDRLKKILKVTESPDVKMHKLSDGQRQSVQIVMAMMPPFNVLLLDECTVDLDVLARRRLMEFLKGESLTKQSTILYATHIFDMENAWPTHIMHVGNKGIKRFEKMEDLTKDRDIKILDLVIEWLEEEEEEERIRGPVPEDPEDIKESLEQKLMKTNDKFYNYWN